MRRILIILALLFSTSTLSSDVVWSEDKSALAFCSAKDSKTVCFVVCNDKVVDVSGVEIGNLGKIGNYEYEKVATFPVQWRSNNENSCMFWFKTQAWINGQRHTVKGLALVKDGEFRRR